MTGSEVLENRGDKVRNALVAAVTLSAICFYGSSYGASLEEELSVLVVDDPRVLSARDSIETAVAGIDRAKSGYYPRVRVSGDAGYEETDSPARRASPGEALTRGRQRATGTVTENIFEGFRTQSNVKAAMSDKLVAESRYQQALQGRLFEGVAAYLNVLRQLDLLEIARENERTIMEQLSLEDERVKRGSGITVDVLLAKSRLQLAKERRVLFEGELENAVSRYIQVFDRAPRFAAMATPEVPVRLLPGEVDAGVSVALAENPAVVGSNRLIEVATARREAAKADYYPSVDLVLRGNWEDDVAGIVGVRRDWSALVQLSWELFSGGATRAQVRQASSELSARRNDHNFVNRAVAEQVRLSWEELETARERQALLENAVVIAQEVFELRGKLRDAGKETAINVLDAQTEVNDARLNLVAADYDARVAVYRVLQAMGRLTPENLNVRTAELDDLERTPGTAAGQSPALAVK